MLQVCLLSCLKERVTSFMDDPHEKIFVQCENFVFYRVYPVWKSESNVIYRRTPMKIFDHCETNESMVKLNPVSVDLRMTYLWIKFRQLDHEEYVHSLKSFLSTKQQSCFRSGFPKERSADLL